jgi:hypothetical protein
VDKLWTNFRVGAVQRRKIKHWRGFRRGAFGYNEGPTKQLPYVFVGRRVTGLTCLFFDRDTPLRGFTSLRDMSLRRNGRAVVASAGEAV